MADPDPPKPVLFHRPLMRCIVAACRRWWSVHPEEQQTAMCPCGGGLELIELDKHTAALSFASPEEVFARGAVLVEETKKEG